MKLLIPIVALFIFLSSCCGPQWVTVASLNWLEPVYKIDPATVCRIDTVDTPYGDKYIVYYKGSRRRK